MIANICLNCSCGTFAICSALYTPQRGARPAMSERPSLMARKEKPTGRRDCGHGLIPS